MITIIITAYNIESTISKAIDSCLNQTYKDLEIIIVNDCSTDGTKSIIETYTDPRIKLIDLETNVGCGMSRRIGTQQAQGDFTLFLDGDDWLENDCIETLYNIQKQTNVDIVSCGINVITDTIVKSTYPKFQVLTTAQAINDSSATIKRFLNNKLIRRSLWNQVEYSDRRFVEDTQTCFYILWFGGTIANTPYCGYNYYQNPNSLCHKANKLKFAIYKALCAKDICLFLKKHDITKYDMACKDFLYRVKELQKIKIDEQSRIKYKDELSEICCLLLNIISV